MRSPQNLTDHQTGQRPLVILGVGTRASQVTASHLDVSGQQPVVVEGFGTRTLMVNDG